MERRRNKKTQTKKRSVQASRVQVQSSKGSNKASKFGALHPSALKPHYPLSTYPLSTTVVRNSSNYRRACVTPHAAATLIDW
eukprot:scaffold5943_cov148-Skeletonema_menzelii.AAC.6